MMLTAVGGLTQAEAQHSAGGANAAIDRWNAANARIQAGQTVQTGAMASNLTELKGRVAEGQQRAAMGASGTLVSGGTNAAILSGTEETTAMNATMLRLNASRAAMGLEQTADIDESKANFAEKSSDQAAIATLIKTGATMSLYDDPNYKQAHGGGGMGGGYAGLSNGGYSGSDTPMA